MGHAQEKPDVSGKLTCSQCNNEITPTDSFCAGCGAAVSDTAQSRALTAESNTAADRQKRITEILSQPTIQEQLRYIVTLYAIVGIGFGLVGAIGINLISGDSGTGSQLLSGLFALSTLAIIIFVGPIMAAVSGLHIAERMHQAERTVYITSFVGNTAGYLAMVILAVILLIVFAGSGSSSGGGGGDIFSLGELFVPLVVLALPSGLVGLGSTYLHLQNQ